MNRIEKDYHPEPYWSEVARRISRREGRNVIAGDDEPYYRYKRRRFLQLLHGIDFTTRKVLELGCGPGGNLLEVLRRDPASLIGADISSEMLRLAAASVNDPRVSFAKVDGEKLPFDDAAFDLSFTATVLQHNTDPRMLEKVLGELCRVTRDELVLLERIERTEKGDQLCIGRPVDAYAALCSRYGFTLKSVDFINTRISYFVSGAIRKLLNPGTRQEGEPISPFANFLQRMTLPVTCILDRLIPSPTDVARMVFVRREEQ